MKFKNHRLPVWLLYTASFVVIATLSFGVLSLAGRTFIWDMDGIAQHYPIMHEFQRLLHHGGLGSLTGWSWTFGIGADKLTTLAYYVLGDPFAYLLALLPTKMLETGYGWMVIARLYVSGLAIIPLAKQYHFRPSSQWLGALAYAFTGYSLMVGVHHPFFLLPMIFFPLLLVGINRILEGHSWTLLGLITGITVLSNFYFAYILGLGSLIYLLIRWRHCQTAGTLKIKGWQVLLRSILAAVGGLLVSGILILPSALMMLSSTRTNGTFANGLTLYPISYYLQLGNTVLTTGNALNYWAVLGISSLSFLGCIYVLRHFRTYRYLAGTLVLCAVGLLFPAVAAFFNVFSTPSNRWLLLVAVPVTLALMTLFDHFNELEPRDGWWLLGGSLALLLVVYAGNGFIFNNDARNFVSYGFLLVVTLLAVASSRVPSRWLKLLAGLVVGLNLISNAWGYTDVNVTSRANQQLRQGDATRYMQGYFDHADRDIAQGNNFSRVSSTSAYNLFQTVGNNMTMAHQLRGVMSYFSVQNGAVGAFSKDVQNAQFAMNSPLGQLDGRSSLNHLLGVKELFTRQDQLDEKTALPYGYHVTKKDYPEVPVYSLSNGTGTRILKTSLNLPLVYSQPKILTSYQWDQLDAVDKERSLTQAAVVDSGKGLTQANYQSPKKVLDYTVAVDQKPVIDSANKVVSYRLAQAAAGQKSILNSKQRKTYGPKITVPKIETDSDGLMSKANKDKYASAVKLEQNQQALDYVLGQNKRILANNQAINKTGLHQMTSDAQGHRLTYTLTLDQPQLAQGAELYLEIDGISSEQLNAQRTVQQKANSAILGGQPRPTTTKINNWRNALLNPDLGSFWLTARTRNQSKSFAQMGVDKLSDYEPRRHALMNLGYSKAVRKTVKVTFHSTHQINFKSVRLVAMPFRSSYNQQIRRIQRRGLRAERVTNNRVSGTLKMKEAGIMTTSMPYSSGWRLTVDNRPVKTLEVNAGFVGAQLTAGKHQIVLAYETPGLWLGIDLTITGLVGLLIFAIIHNWPKRRQYKH
ncbi:glycosyltransferase [Levilactobacillus koreensis JCM 16448]|uniref:Glycosyltransferase n=1 Tax=Levilactobacillus koreensis TaxID=637971 RepID=A0AAC9ER84_9LACO|nr:YfhO family protein [Levilactobacillus koreensis]AKP64186.1 glycosyltransferase [Levilactobacillus koreensis]KRK91540.1 glycosyltransferase [Levilactobacillus koreensis JCM 16448]